MPSPLKSPTPTTRQPGAGGGRPLSSRSMSLPGGLVPLSTDAGLTRVVDPSPGEVGHAVAVEVAYADDPPARCRHGQAFVLHDRLSVLCGPVKQPDAGLTGIDTRRRSGIWRQWRRWR